MSLRPFPALPPEHNVPAFPPRPRRGDAGDRRLAETGASDMPSGRDVSGAMEDFLPPMAARRLDVALLAVLAIGAGWLFWGSAARLEYDWNWSMAGRYLIRHDAERGWVPGMLAQGLLVTLRLGVWSTLLALCIGTGMGLLRASPRLFRRMVARTYVEGVRNLPPLVLVFIFHFFVSPQLEMLFTPLLSGLFTPATLPAWLQDASALVLAPPEQFPVFLSGVLILGLYEGAYVTEIVRAGLEGVERGQWEASASTGLTRRQQLRHVILPQAFRLIVPPLAGQFISTIKDSAILSVISIRELTFQGMELMAATYLTFEIWLTVATLYLVLTFSCSLAARHVEQRLRRAV